jgi:hypothetical protein
LLKVPATRVICTLARKRLEVGFGYTTMELSPVVRQSSRGRPCGVQTLCRFEMASPLWS